MVIEHCFFQNFGQRSINSGGLEKFGGAVHIVCSHHNVNPRCTLLHDVAIFLGQAARDHDLTTFARVFPTLEHSEIAVQLIVGVFTNTARIQHNDIGVVLVFNGPQTVGVEQTGDSLRIVVVHLAPKGAHDIRTRILSCHSGFRIPLNGHTQSSTKLRKARPLATWRSRYRVRTSI